MSETHSLNLKIDASAAKAGAAQFAAAVLAIKKAVSDLDRESDGTFTKLKDKAANLRLTPVVDRTGIATLTEYERAQAKLTAGTARQASDAAKLTRLQLSVAQALRTSSREATYLGTRLDAVGATAGIQKLNTELTRLKSGLAGAGTGLDVRVERSGFADTVGGLRQQAEEQEKLERATRNSAVEADRLRATYVPLYAESQRYAVALGEITRAEQLGILTAQQAGAARESAAAAMASTTTASQGFTKAAHGNAAAISNVSAQFQDVAVMMAAGQNPFQLAMQQGTQLSAVLNQMGGRTAILRTLASGFMMMVNPVSLVTIGVIAAGAAIVNWMSSGSEATMSFGEALNDADSKISALSRSTDTLASAKLGQLADGYGRVNEELRIHLERLAQIAKFEAVAATRTTISALESSMTGGWLTTPVDDIRIALDTTNDGARQFLGLLSQIKQARTFEEQVAAIKTAREYLESTGVTLDTATGAAQEMLMGLIKAEDSALRLRNAAAESGSAISGAVGQTAAWASAMSGVGAEINAILSSLSAIGGSVIGNAAKRAESTALAAGATVREAEVARMRYQHETEMRAKEMGAGDGISGLINRQLIAAERFQFDEGIRLDDQLNVQREGARERDTSTTRGGGGGGSKKETPAEELRKKLMDSLASTKAQTDSLQYLQSGLFGTADAATLYAEAMAQGGGRVTEANMAVLGQIDVLGLQAAALEKAASDPLKEFLATVPGWVDGMRSIEMALAEGVQGSLESLFSGEGMNAKGLTDKLRNQISSVLASQTMKFGMDALGIKGSMVGGGSKEAAAIQSAGMAASASIQTGIVTGGMQAAQMMQAALSGAALGSLPAAGGAAGAGAGGGILGGLLSLASGFFAEGGYTDRTPMSTGLVSPAAFRHAPQFAQGTPNTSGIPAVLHPNEAVIPLSKGRKVPVELGGADQGGGGLVVSVSMQNTINVTANSDDGGEAVSASILKTLDSTFEARILETVSRQMEYGGLLRPRGY
ncbi:hypothetical protein FAZ78_12640 [Cereibacter changlensis]|uniref:Bacteriophage tail tape measure N-terminal domain-containing protein n=1 Tax=Cereibacter changlensis TaxID=402884 RepID=A0A4U0YU70_9RHOB|nr:phage tail length tape measure family protein [Cereibacter changlensis]TKA96222.1 hypothetical protein FAZ78_12640 [Cereibacter changlensis]